MMSQRQTDHLHSCSFCFFFYGVRESCCQPVSPALRLFWRFQMCVVYTNLTCLLTHPVDVPLTPLRCPTVKESRDEKVPKAQLTGTSVVAFWIPHPKVSHGAWGEAHAYLTDVIALQEDEKLGLAFNAAVVLGASVTAFGAGWWPLSTNCGNIR